VTGPAGLFSSLSSFFGSMMRHPQVTFSSPRRLEDFSLHFVLFLFLPARCETGSPYSPASSFRPSSPSAVAWFVLLSALLRRNSLWQFSFVPGITVCSSRFPTFALAPHVPPCPFFFRCQAMDFSLLFSSFHLPPLNGDIAGAGPPPLSSLLPTPFLLNWSHFYSFSPLPL